MPIIEAVGLRQYYRLDGPDDRPVLIFAHSLGCDHTMWDAQTAALTPYFRILRYDIRGHGGTAVPPGDYTIERLGRDVLGLADALGVREFAFCGLSLGGMIGQWLGANAGGRLTALVLANTSARFPDPSVMEERRRTVLEGGMAVLEPSVMGRFFSPERLQANPPEAAGLRRVLLATDPVGYAGCCGAIRDMDQRPLLSAIQTPVLIIVGDRDISTPWLGHGEILAQGIAGSRIEHLPTAHLSNLETPRAFAAILEHFLIPEPSDSPSAGAAKQRAILGEAHADRATGVGANFKRPFEELVTRYAWGAVWQRPGLDDRTRRLLALTTAAALGQWEEFRLHVHTALTGGLEPCDIQEALLQLAIYAGLPAASTAFQIAGEELAG